MNILQTFTAKLSCSDIDALIRAHVEKEHPNFTVKTTRFDIYPAPSNVLGIGGGVVVGGYQQPYFTGASISLEPKPRPPRSAQAYEA